jgi:hypothetical protein
MSVSILALRERPMLVEGEAEQIVPTPQAIYGLIFLASSPFSLFTVNIRLMASAAVLALYAAVRPKILGSRSAQSLQVLDGSRLRQIYFWLTLIFFHAIFCSTISTSILLQNGEASGLDILYRGGTQLGTLLLESLQIGFGYHMAKYIGRNTMRTVIYATFWITIALCTYQSLSVGFGLPYVGKWAYESNIGLRPSALAMEPKFLSGYLLCVAALLFVDRHVGRGLRFVSPLFRVVGIAMAGYFFLRTASGNGYTSLAILLIVYFLAFPTARKALFGIGLGLALLAIVPGLEISDLGLRQSHQSILENISNFHLGLFDDLIALPMMAWRDNPLSVLIGFGPGLMHFFANRYLDLATWLPGDTIIEGNVSAIMYISNFGLFVAATLFLSVFRKARCAIIWPEPDADRPLLVYFLSMFVTGTIVGSHVSVPLFLAAGWILGSVKQRQALAGQ